VSAAPVSDAGIAAHIAFLYADEHLKDTERSGRTPGGRRESVMDHTLRLCLMALALEDDLADIDTGRLLRMLIVHDLGEAIGGDVSAPDQKSDKTTDERADMAGLAALLPEAAGARLMTLWDEYAATRTPEARLAKGLDRIETLLHHVQGSNGPDFDYGFNLRYGRERTDAHPLTRALREPIDDETRRLAGAASPTHAGPDGRSPDR
jgi:putative hydrolase of HD superfamily